jgi:ribose 5-phosphate isomerase A
MFILGAVVSTIEQYKQQAAESATQFVSSGMVVGLGTGSTAMYATRRIGQLLRDGCFTTLWACQHRERRLPWRRGWGFPCSGAMSPARLI